jgi:potassium-transporting ATPase ATP-binding subunit
MAKFKADSSRSLFDAAIIRSALGASFTKLNPREMMKNPVMFVVEVGTALVTLLYVADLMHGHAVDSKLTVQLILWLWFTLLFANFAEAVAEGRGKAQAATLRKMRTTTTALRTRKAADSASGPPSGDGRESGDLVPATELRKGDFIYVKAGDLIPSDGEIIEGVASVDESAITGESAPVVREAGGDRSAVTGGTRVLSDWLVIEVRQDPGSGFIDRMIALVEGAERQKTPNEIALTILLAGLTIIFLAATAGLIPSARFFAGNISVLLLVSLLVCLIPTTIGALLSAIGIAGMDRLVQYNVIATSGRAVEAAGDIDVLMLDKTGTITYGSRQAFELVPATGVSPRQLAEVAMLSSLADETPEGKSIVILAEKTLGERLSPEAGTAVPFTAQTRMSGLDLGGRTLRKGATDAVARHITALGGALPEPLMIEVKRIANEGGTPLVVAEGSRAYATASSDSAQWVSRP